MVKFEYQKTVGFCEKQESDCRICEKEKGMLKTDKNNRSNWTFCRIICLLKGVESTIIIVIMCNMTK